jgi:hypothetical protein
MLNLGEYRKYVTQEEKIEKEYKIKFVDNVEKTFEAKGVINAIKSYIDTNIINKVELKEANEEIKAKEAEKVTSENTALSVISNEDIEILKQMIREYKLNSKNASAGTSENTTNNFDYTNIQIPTTVRKMKIETFSIRANAKLYEKLKEIAKINNISVSTLINYLFFTFLNNINVISESDIEE